MMYFAIEVAAQAVPDIDYSNIQEWKVVTIIAMAVSIILVTVIPGIIGALIWVVRSNNKAHKEQLLALNTQMNEQAASYQKQLDGLMVHQKEQIERICSSHVEGIIRTSNTYDRSLEIFQRSLEKRDNDHVAIMQELRTLNDKVDDVKVELAGHINHHETIKSKNEHQS